jgi:integrase/recombinase XerD
MIDIIVAFKEHLTIIKSLSIHTIEAYIRDVEDFNLLLLTKNKTLLNSTSEDLINYLQTIKNPRTQNRHLSSINSFYSFCDTTFDISQKPQSSFAKIPKTLPKYLSNEQIMKNLQLIDTSKELGLRDYAMILFLYATGVRVSELINIKKNDIEETLIKVLYSKGSKQRVVPIAQTALTALYSYLNTRKIKSNHLFIN